jgi:hypothetical protein
VALGSSSPRSCEHAFVSASASAYGRFHRALERQELSEALAAAAELPQVRLDDALELVILMARDRDRRFDRAAARWIGRLLVENNLGLQDARYALVLVERLPSCRDALRRLTHQR